MSQVELKMPKMGESVAEATITKWLKKEGDRVEQDEPILEIATDKVDSEVPSTAAGILVKQLYNEGDVVAVGKSIAIIGDSASATVPTSSVPKAEEVKIAAAPVIATQAATVATTVSASSKFYSPLVRNIAQQENVSSAELDAITGTGAEGRVTKKDI
ncbi:MAG: biotin/lipoyl-containing protein, partial [Bacteroidota bacterium]